MLAYLLCSVLEIGVSLSSKPPIYSHEAKNKLVEIGTREKKAEVFSDSADVLLSRERPTELGNSSIVCLVMYSSLYL